MIKVLAHRLDLYDRTIVMMLFGLVVSMLIGYSYFLTLSVFAVVERNHAEREIDAIKGKLAQNEEKYVAVTRNITMDMAKDKGFIEVTSPRYISSVPKPATLTMRNGE